VRALFFIFSLVLLPTVGLHLDNGASAQTTENRAGLVVQGPDDTTQTYCISFEGDTISGLDLLIKSGLPLKVEAYGGMGAEVCQIGATGCDYPNQACACQSYGPNGVYWSYHHLQDNKWKASITGAGSYQVHPGDVEGWAWSDGAPPKVYTFSQLCPAAEPPPSPTQPEPSATAVPPALPSHTRTPRPIPPTSTATEQPTQNIRQPMTPTAVRPTETPTQIATMQPATTQTSISPLTSTATPTNPPASTPAAIATATSTTTPQPQPPAPNPEGTARVIGLVIAAGVGVALAVWGAVTLTLRSRKKREK
jgi:hypothetical protein